MPYDRRTYEDPEGMRSDIIMPSETQVCRFCSVFSAASAKADRNKSMQEQGFCLISGWQNGIMAALQYWTERKKLRKILCEFGRKIAC